MDGYIVVVGAVSRQGGSPLRMPPVAGASHLEIESNLRVSTIGFSLDLAG